ncbi:MAG: antitoxin AF2212-like protein [Acidobacteriota bacterium]
MSKRIEVVYENGVLRPLEPLLLRDQQRVSIVLPDDVTSPADEDWLDTECLRLCNTEDDDTVTLDAVRQALSKIPGSMTSDFMAERHE